ncbi:hypothetical protein JOC77_000189 [Peribacillus deserti]|uniref:Transposase n=1 Tax=Peribacillus deserti TaxID=673318 RepID=A0ABS2QC93_9BACI|nr:hypothetical protein [Peribacillus deserti]MBM7690786.1 hypothetical protein [Peribacillus deserti]
MKKLLNQSRYAWHRFHSLKIEMIIKDCIDRELRSKLYKKLEKHNIKALLYKAVV